MVVASLRRTGYKRINLRTDGEAGLVSLMNVVMQQWEGECVPQVSAPGDWKSHGPVENAVKLMKGYVRTIVDSLEHRLQTKLDPEHPIITWVVQYVATTYFRYSQGHDGMTPEQRTTGRQSHQLSAEFGERVWWKPLSPQHRAPALQARTEDGFYLGPVEGSNESFFMTSSGAVRARTFFRRPDSEKWSVELLDVKASVLQPNMLDPSASRIGIKAPVHLPDRPVDAPEGPPISEDNIAKPRSFKIYPGDLEKYGFTLGCPGCDAVIYKTDRRGHLDRCRSRLEKAMREDPLNAHRVESTFERFNNTSLAE